MEYKEDYDMEEGMEEEYGSEEEEVMDLKSKLDEKKMEIEEIMGKLKELSGGTEEGKPMEEKQQNPKAMKLMQMKKMQQMKGR